MNKLKGKNETWSSRGSFFCFFFGFKKYLGLAAETDAGLLHLAGAHVVDAAHHDLVILLYQPRQLGEVVCLPRSAIALDHGWLLDRDF
jgi:hypothetical protein